MTMTLQSSVVVTDPQLHASTSAQSPAILELHGISKLFDGKPALAHASFSVRAGEIHALLGENGAGKSTLMTIACGIYQADAGTLVFDNAPVRLSGPKDAHRLGVRMVHQHFKLVSQFSVRENILFACAQQVRERGRAAVLEASQKIADELGWPLEMDQLVAKLPVAGQQRVEIVKTLTQGARVLILDEPTAVLTDAESDALMARMRGLAAGGMAIVIITHRLREVAMYADRYTVMRRGATVATGMQKDIDITGIARLMVGETPMMERRPTPKAGRVVLSLNDIVTEPAEAEVHLRGVQLQVRAGEIYGVAGIGDNGQRELVEALNGTRALSSGQIVLDARRIDSMTTRARRALGLRVIPADRFADALCGDLSIADNFAITQYPDGLFGGPFALDRKALRASVERQISAYEIHGGTPDTRTRLLSGGNAQKLLLCRELQGDRRLIVASSPTRGLDVRARATVHSLLFEARDAGAAVLVLSEDLDEVLLLSDRVGVLNRGRIVGEADSASNQNLDRDTIGALMLIKT
jgi:ABC-type uncharacterized transport system ATPase subunit